MFYKYASRERFARSRRTIRFSHGNGPILGAEDAILDFGLAEGQPTEKAQFADRNCFPWSPFCFPWSPFRFPRRPSWVPWGPPCFPFGALPPTARGIPTSSRRNPIDIADRIVGGDAA